jgi:DNA (cytosine-5)-methyltransferase 1
MTSETMALDPRHGRVDGQPIGSARRPAHLSQMRLFSRVADVELFAGAGGLSLGLAAAGLPAEHLFERNPRACGTLRTNGHRHKATIEEADVRDVDWSAYAKPARLLAAGPPCQPFSLAGNHLGDEDPRNEFPATLRAIRDLQPAVVLVENVHGLTRPSFRPYFDYVLRQLAFPSLAPNPGETWREHDVRLVSRERGRGVEPEYAIRAGVLNAADYGVPQMRTRVVVIATRAGYPVVELPAPTHSRAALIQHQVSGGYWERHNLTPPSDYEPPKRGPAQHEDEAACLLPWRTVREALAGLPDPGSSVGIKLQHEIIPGARLYRGHRGSAMDWPSKTIKAGVHGVAGGENIIHLDDGTFRYFTLREMARIQGFPDDYVFFGPRSRIIGQIGNAVPCGLAEALGRQIIAMFKSVPELSPPTDPSGRRGAARHVHGV